ncbi:MAG: hypothetical protein Q3965_05650, partial [Rothia sp. (in: high G+C Gram-positive bacteria)]|nr:hypothetical protein [Rothia sp. (in: high G+C Gram-positive bacteria)]
MAEGNHRVPFDENYPVYRGGANPKTTEHGHLLTQQGRRVLDGWVDHLYFVFAGFASIWLALVALVDAWNHSWYGVPLALAFWAIAAYLT